MKMSKENPNKNCVSTKIPLREKIKNLVRCFKKRIKKDFETSMNWLSNNKFIQIISRILILLDRIASSISRALWRLLPIGLLALIVLYLNPEIGQKFPIFFQISEGIISVFEWTFKALFGFIRIIYELLTGDFRTSSEIINSLWNNFIELFQQLWNWIQTIQF